MILHGLKIYSLLLAVCENKNHLTLFITRILCWQLCKRTSQNSQWPYPVMWSRKHGRHRGSYSAIAQVITSNDIISSLGAGTGKSKLYTPCLMKFFPMKKLVENVWQSNYEALNKFKQHTDLTLAYLWKAIVYALSSVKCADLDLTNQKKWLVQKLIFWRYSDPAPEPAYPKVPSLVNSAQPRSWIFYIFYSASCSHHKG